MWLLCVAMPILSDQYPRMYAPDPHGLRTVIGLRTPDELVEAPDVFAAVADRGLPAHPGGKDRTGVVIAVLLAAVGVSKDDIVMD